jgi:archaellum component FlaC
MEEPNLVLEQLRLIRSENKEINERLDRIEQRLTRIETNVQGLADIAVNTTGMLRTLGDRLRQLEITK